MKLEICDDVVYVDGVAHVLLSNSPGHDRVRQRINIGGKLEDVQPAVAPPPPPEPEAERDEAESEPLTTSNLVQ